MSQPLTLLEDMYVTARGEPTALELRQIVAEAESQELERICLCLRAGASERSAAWARAIREASAWSSIEVYSGVEARLLDEEGRLDLPSGPARTDFVFLSTRRYPLGEKSYPKAQVEELAKRGPIRLHHFRQVQVLALARALHRHQNVILADLFSNVHGLWDADEADDQQVKELVELLVVAAEETGAGLLVNESHRCPSLAVARRFYRAQVPVFFGTGAEWPGPRPRYRFAETLLEELLSG